MTYLSITTHISLRATDERLAFRHLAGFGFTDLSYHGEFIENGCFTSNVR